MARLEPRAFTVLFYCRLMKPLRNRATTAHDLTLKPTKMFVFVSYIYAIWSFPHTYLHTLLFSGLSSATLTATVIVVMLPDDIDSELLVSQPCADNAFHRQSARQGSFSRRVLSIVLCYRRSFGWVVVRLDIGI